MEFIINNLTVILIALWAISEVLALIPNIKSNSVFQLIYNSLQRFKR